IYTHMPKRKKTNQAAKTRLVKQKRDSLTGKFAPDTDSDYILSDAVYSSESENEAQLIERSNSLLPIKLVWTKKSEILKKRAAYTGNSKSTKYRKIGPSGSFTKTAQST